MRKAETKTGFVATDVRCTVFFDAPSETSKENDKVQTKFLELNPEVASANIMFAHGAGAPMDSPSMTAIAAALVEQGLRIIRFEFSYMAKRRTEGTRKPPPRAENLNSEYLAAIEELKLDGPLIIGGKSMGGRVASMIVDELFDGDRISGLLCIGYPFHPIGKPEKLRTEHLKAPPDPNTDLPGKPTMTNEKNAHLCCWSRLYGTGIAAPKADIQCRSMVEMTGSVHL